MLSTSASLGEEKNNELFIQNYLYSSFHAGNAAQIAWHMNMQQ